jgi:hypothetical protein
MDLSVGFPVKKRLKSDAIESEEWIPDTSNIIPIARRAIPISLFILLVLPWLTQLFGPGGFTFSLHESGHLRNRGGGWMVEGCCSQLAGNPPLRLAFRNAIGTTEPGVGTDPLRVAEPRDVNV